MGEKNPKGAHRHLKSVFEARLLLVVGMIQSKPEDIQDIIHCLHEKKHQGPLFWQR